MNNQNIVSFLLLISALTFINAQKPINQYDKNGKRHGLWTKNYHKTNQKRYEGTFVHGKEIDTFKYYKLHQGKSVLSAFKIFNKNDSIADVTFLASNKKVVSKGKMNGKRFIGSWVYYHKNATSKMIVENYNADGELHGHRKVFYNNGVVAEQSFYSHGKRNGLSERFSEQNKIIKSANYKDNELHGKYITYDANGKKVSEGYYTYGKKSGLWFYNEDGKEESINYGKPKAN